MTDMDVLKGYISLRDERDALREQHQVTSFILSQGLAARDIPIHPGEHPANVAFSVIDELNQALVAWSRGRAGLHAQGMANVPPDEVDMTAKINELEMLKLRVEKIREMLEIQSRDGNWNFSPHMRGMLFGLELAMATIEDREPLFIDEPEQWLCDKPPHNAVLPESLDEHDGQPIPGWDLPDNGAIAGDFDALRKPVDQVWTEKEMVTAGVPVLAGMVQQPLCSTCGLNHSPDLAHVKDTCPTCHQVWMWLTDDDKATGYDGACRDSFHDRDL